MPTIGPIIAAPARLSLLYAQRLLKDVPAAKFARLARPGGVLLTANHPAFIFGHLALYPQKIMSHLGLPAGPTAPPASYDALFRDGLECRDDADGSLYPPMAELTQVFLDSYNAAVAAVSAASDAALLAPNPNEGRSRELFPSLGGMFAFYLSGHVQVHLGQFSTWRRAMGMPAA